jgi:hypothetical protein
MSLGKSFAIREGVDLDGPEPGVGVGCRRALRTRVAVTLYWRWLMDRRAESRVFLVIRCRRDRGGRRIQWRRYQCGRLVAVVEESGPRRS